MTHRPRPDDTTPTAARRAPTRHRASRLPACTALALLAGSALSLRAQAQSSDPFPAAFELSSLLPANGGDGSNGFVLNGIDTGDYSGHSVSSAGDVNGDGFDDLIIGAFGADPDAKLKAGECYVVFGGPGVSAGGTINLASLNSLGGPYGFAIKGIDAYDFSGYSVSSAGDVNGDGIDDLLIGADLADPNGVSRAGESYLIFGAANLGTSGTGAGGSFNLASLNGTNGFVLNGIGTDDTSGRAVSQAGDVNGDGIDDLIIGAPLADPAGRTDAGESYVVFGKATLGAGGAINLTPLKGTIGFAINGTSPGDYAGRSASSAGDLNGDGIDDLIIGAPLADPNGNSRAGQSYVVFGATDVGFGGVVTRGFLELSSLVGANGFAINGINANDFSGYSVAAAGDVNGDGFDDLILGAPAADPNANPGSGESYLVFGAPDLGAGGVGTAGSFSLASLNGANGFVINGVNAGDSSGFSVSSAGDINGDGLDDLIIGASSAQPHSNPNAGESYVVFGARDLGTGGVGTSGTFELASLDGTNGFSIRGIDQNDLSGHSVSAAGDVNGDGIDDLVIGAKYADPNGITNAGESYVIFGRNLCPPDLNKDGVVDNGDIGFFVALFLAGDLAADLNADGILDHGDISAFIAAFLEGC